MSEIKAVPTVNGRAWRWTHGDFEYQAVHFTGATRVRLYDRWAGTDNGGWGFCRVEPISDTYTALDAVRHLHHTITSNAR